MKPQDLRIGNYFLGFDNKPFKWELDHFTMVGSSSIDFDEIINEPIPLTEEWLLKCGFTPCESIFKNKPNILSIQISNNETLDYEDGELFIANVGSHRVVTFWKNIIHLHQLQNLYHALTGKELEVQL